MITKETKKQRYLNVLPLYGGFTLVYMLKEYQKDENYEECKIILDALKEHNSKYNSDLPTMFGEKSDEYFKKVFEAFGFIGDIAEWNLPYYAEEVRKIVNDQT